MQLVNRGVSYSDTSSLLQNNTQLRYRGAKYFPTISSPRHNIELSYRGNKYCSVGSPAIAPVASQKLSYRGTTYYRGEPVDTLN
ncbi:DUF4278 domain-containing protein [Aerosakkonemataceae cyanobacterium BLCC-F50]|uniref:DUF4278 domain-containing protein n=1 Tax=Floridaenema flaviceps BLCC-F50 TaxID=3153642 RepID=A0ABV4XU63_9CYAN